MLLVQGLNKAKKRQPRNERNPSTNGFGLSPQAITLLFWTCLPNMSSKDIQALERHKGLAKWQ